MEWPAETVLAPVAQSSWWNIFKLQWNIYNYYWNILQINEIFLPWWTESSLGWASFHPLWTEPGTPLDLLAWWGRNLGTYTGARTPPSHHHHHHHYHYHLTILDHTVLSWVSITAWMASLQVYLFPFTFSLSYSMFITASGSLSFSSLVRVIARLLLDELLHYCALIGR